MKISTRNMIILTALMLIFTIVLVSCYNNSEIDVAVSAKPLTENELRISIPKIGKADSFLFHSDSGVVLIDCGEYEDGEEILTTLKSNGISTIDYLIITHFDKDHVGGAEYILKHFEVKNVIEPDRQSDGAEYRLYKTALKKLGMTATTLTETMDIQLGSVIYRLYPAHLSSAENNDDNYCSIVVKVIHGENTLLFTGDAVGDRLKELIEMGDEIDCDFLKVPHHGVYEELSEEFIEAVSPEIAVITCSKKNKESDEVMNILSNVGATTYRTRKGDITVSSDGTKITVTQGNNEEV